MEIVTEHSPERTILTKPGGGRFYQKRCADLFSDCGRVKNAAKRVVKTARRAVAVFLCVGLTHP
jgi:hypothetical protein